jgi:hypothetical protein
MSRAKDRALKTAKEARGGSGFLPLTLPALHSQALTSLSPHAGKLLFDLCSQWRLGHNGDLSAAWTTLQPRGWKSKETLQKALNELRASGLIVLTRQGGRHLCSLYGLGWLAIDGCGGKLDIAATSKPMSLFESPLKIKTSATLTVAIQLKRNTIDPPSVAPIN